MNVVSYKARPNAKDFIQVEIVVEKNSQKIILIGRVCPYIRLWLIIDEFMRFIFARHSVAVMLIPGIAVVLALWCQFWPFLHKTEFLDTVIEKRSYIWVLTWIATKYNLKDITNEFWVYSVKKIIWNMILPFYTWIYLFHNKDHTVMYLGFVLNFFRRERLWNFLQQLLVLTSKIFYKRKFILRC